MLKRIKKLGKYASNFRQITMSTVVIHLNLSLRKSFSLNPSTLISFAYVKLDWLNIHPLLLCIMCSIFIMLIHSRITLVCTQILFSLRVLFFFVCGWMGVSLYIYLNLTRFRSFIICVQPNRQLLYLLLIFWFFFFSAFN